ncbi:MAG: aminoglycoside phosphotransferase family protein [Alphaproteobacteria bacterium]|nr:aminoglycoside phosphotransferase family protein [Alphaproteobacteria bacterium]
MTPAKGPLLAAGNVAEVFEWGDRVLKLYKSPAAKPVAFREAAIHAAVEALGLPVPSVWGVERVDERWGIVFDRVSAASFADRMRSAPDAVPDYLDRMARLHIAIHQRAAVSFGSLKLRLASRIEETTRLESARKKSLLAGLAEMPDGDRLCHGDFHPLNILGDIGNPIIIDWPDACRGDPAADLCRTYVLLALHAADLAVPYLDAYGRRSGVSREAALAWLPYVAAAKLAEEVPGETSGLTEILGLPTRSP